MRSKVDLPEPLAPTSATRSRSLTVQLAWSNTTWLPNCRQRLLILSTTPASIGHSPNWQGGRRALALGRQLLYRRSGATSRVTAATHRGDLLARLGDRPGVPRLASRRRHRRCRPTGGGVCAGGRQPRVRRPLLDGGAGAGCAPSDSVRRAPRLRAARRDRNLSGA